MMTCGACRFFRDTQCYRYPPNIGAPHPGRQLVPHATPACGEFQGTAPVVQPQPEGRVNVELLSDGSTRGGDGKSRKAK